MKKIMCVTCILVLLASASFAADLATKLTSTKLSNNVTGTYFSNNTSAGGDATMYVLSTGHASGNKVYAGGNFVSEIYSKDISGTAFASTDLIGTEPSYDSSAFDSSWTAL